jgi:hypothetical protein
VVAGPKVSIADDGHHHRGARVRASVTQPPPEESQTSSEDQ